MAEIDIVSYDPSGVNCKPEVLESHKVDGNIVVDVIADRKVGNEYTVLGLPSAEVVCALVLLISQLPIDNPETTFGFSLKTDRNGAVLVGRTSPTLYNDSIDKNNRVVFREV